MKEIQKQQDMKIAKKSKKNGARKLKPSQYFIFQINWKKLLETSQN